VGLLPKYEIVVKLIPAIILTTCNNAINFNLAQFMTKE
jgi:hypothetical protein